MASRRSSKRFLDSSMINKLMRSHVAWLIFKRLPQNVRKSIKWQYRGIFDSSEPPLTVLEEDLDRWPSDSPLLTVVVPCHNYGQYIHEALQSIRSQTFQGFELIIIDDASTDDETLRTLEQLKAEGIAVLRREKLNRAEAMNLGVSNARGKYVCCLDPDDTLEATYFEVCLCLLESNIGVTFAYSLMRAFGAEHWVGAIQPFNLRLLLDYNHVSGPAVFRKSAWDSVGGFDQSLDGFEDWEFWIKLGKHG